MDTGELGIAARAPGLRVMRVIAAAVVEAGRLLVVSKWAAPSVFYLPGGKPEPAEAELECLDRELAEELGVVLRKPEHLVEVRARAALEHLDMHMTVFLAGLAGTPRRGGEIASVTWWSERHELTLAPAVRDHVVPALRSRGLL
jgi:8-oxo-dGTP diphosphatase